MFSPEGFYYRDSAEFLFQYVCVSNKCLKTEISSFYQPYFKLKQLDKVWL